MESLIHSSIILFLALCCRVGAQELYDCDAVLTIDSSLESIGCQNLQDDDGVMYACDSLKSMLEFVANDEIEAVNCTELLVTAGNHTINQNYTFVGKNIRIARDPETSFDSVQISFDIIVDLNNTNNLTKFEPLYVWTFDSSKMIEISGLFFENSPGIILFTNISYVTIEDSHFLYFVESALDIYNSPHVTITNCTFKHCGHNANVLKTRSYSIHAGAVSIAVDTFTTIISEPPYITVNASTFFNNSAIPSASLSRSTNEIFSQQIFTGRGGGLGMAFNSPDDTIEILLNGCLFEENRVKLWGGGAYIIFGFISNHTATTRQSVFIRNKSSYGAGGFFLGTFSGGYPNQFSTSNVIDCDFIENTAIHGAGSVWPVPGASTGAINDAIYNRGKYENCRFINNTADNFPALSLVTGDAYHSQLSHTPVEIIDCIFYGNDGGTTPAFSALYAPLILSGHNIFNFNKGGALQLVGSTVVVKNVLEIKNSDIVDSRSGALTISSYAQLTLHKGSRMIFENNTGSIGSSIVVEGARISGIFAGIIFNPLCFLLYEDLRLSPNDWTDVEIVFRGNSAIVGAAVFASQLRICSWTQFQDPYFNDSAAFRWDFITFGENENTFHESESNDPKYYVQTPGHTVQIADKNLTVYPGKAFTINIEVLDELGSSVFSAIRTRDPVFAKNDLHSSFIFNPSVHAVKTKSDNLSSVALIHDDFNMKVKNNRVDVQSIEDQVQLEIDIAAVLTISFTDCPPGYMLTEQIENLDFIHCECNNKNKDIVTCENGTTLLGRDLWATSDNNKDDRLFTFSCPTGYCDCVYQNDRSNCYNVYDYLKPDNQCVTKRKGILCGDCSSDDEGFSALLNNCVSCHNGYSVLIPLLVIADVIALVVLTRYFLCHQYPSWLLPCIFYLQFLPIGSVSLSEGFQFVRPYLLYVSSALSFYFPYDFCLYQNMDALVAYTLRYIPFFIIVVTVSAVIVYCWHCTNLVSNKDWYLIWILVLMNYQFTLYTSMSILNCPSIPTDDDGVRGSWYINGNVQCFTGAHVPLALLAILIIMVLASLIPISLFLSLRIYEQPIWMKRIQRPLHFWFKEEYKWWFSIELARRFLLILMIVPFNGSPYPVSAVYCISFGLFCFAQPYKSTYANLLEIFFSIITIMLYNFEGLTELQYLTNKGSLVNNVVLGISGILYYIPLAVTILLLIIHIVLESRRRYLKFKQRRTRKKPPSLKANMRHFSMATEIKEVTSTVFDASTNTSQKFIGSTLVETTDENSKDELMYSMQTNNACNNNK